LTHIFRNGFFFFKKIIWNIVRITSDRNKISLCLCIGEHITILISITSSQFFLFLKNMMTFWSNYSRPAKFVLRPCQRFHYRPSIRRSVRSSSYFSLWYTQWMDACPDRLTCLVFYTNKTQAEKNSWSQLWKGRCNNLRSMGREKTLKNFTIIFLFQSIFFSFSFSV
jgi:hypothetical protein